MAPKRETDLPYPYIQPYIQPHIQAAPYEFPASSGCTLYPDVLVARREIEAKILDLNARLNELTPLGRTPVEIVAEILIQVAIDDFWDAINEPRLAMSPYQPLKARIRVIHTCRLFHAVALSTPQFWSYVVLTHWQCESLDRLVLLSQGVPLRVAINLENQWFMGLGFTDPLLQQSYLVGELRLVGPPDRLPMTPRVTCTTFFNSGVWTKLETLALECSEPTSFLDEVVTVAQSKGRFPCIRHLEMRSVPFRWRDPVLSCPTLTALTLVVRKADTALPVSSPIIDNFEQLFCTLENIAPCLKIFELEDVFPMVSPSASTPLSAFHTDVPITFRHLQSARLVGECLDIARVLGHVSFPPSTREPLQTVSLAGTHRQPCSLHITGRTRPESSSGGRRTMCAVLSVLLDDDRRRNHTGPLLHEALKFAGTCFQQVVALQLYRLPSRSSRAGMQLVASRFPHLEILTLHEPDDGVFSALTVPVRVPIPDAAGYSSRANPSKESSGEVLERWMIPLPHLRRLELVNFKLSYPSREDVVMMPSEGLFNWAVFRRDLGAPVDALCLSGFWNVHERDIECLREVVGEVHWDGWEREDYPLGDQEQTLS
ncbi:hypothetical protein C8Q77DRAFT_232810 [Trametes polyzona]|nr:hypothetical protein C8Q77DRAFT_232810 [Trametes polyzona]